MKCKICGGEIESLAAGPKEICYLCDHLKRHGMPEWYLRAQRADFNNGLAKCFDMKESLFIYGPVGTGKTWLMAALMREQAKATERSDSYNGFTGYSDKSLFVSFPELMLEIRSTMNPGAQKTEAGVLAKYSKAPTLYFDDVGAERTTDYVRSALFLLVERRKNMLSGRTIITSNLDLNSLAGQHGERIASRIAEMCRIIQVRGPDRRAHKSKGLT